MNHIFIVGFMGAGKTSLGKKLASRLQVPRLDTDLEIERSQALSINDIFRVKGEHCFRNLEQNLLKNLPEESHIISCGGGFPCFHDQLLNMKKKGIVIFLNTKFEILYSRISTSIKRPIVNQKNKSEIKDLFESRKLYYQLSDIEIDNSLSLDEIILKINHIHNTWPHSKT